MAITQLPIAPNRSDPATFSARADALVLALQQLVNEINSQIAGAISTSSIIFNATASDLTIGGTGDKFINANSTNSQKAGYGYMQNSIFRYKEYVDVTTGDYVMERFNTSGVSQGVVARIRATDGVSPAQSTVQKTQILTDLKDVDGVGSGLDADLVRGKTPLFAPNYGSAITCSLGTLYYASTNLLVVAVLTGTYMNGAQLSIGLTTAVGTVIGLAGDDINNNTKSQTITAVIPAGYYYVLQNSSGNAFETIAMKAYQLL